MAINLNPGADSSLVNVAYRAAMANTPADYSRTLEHAADSYERTMDAQSKMWGNVAKLGASIGVDMMANAKELSDYSAKGAGLNPEDAEMFMDELYANKDAQKELGLLGGRFGDRETRKRRSELKIEQKELMADIDLAVESISLGTEAVAAGTYDADINEPEAEMVNAIIKSNLKDKVTKEGNMAKLTRDETSGELMYTMYRENGEVSMFNGKPQTMTIKQFNKSIATNVDDKGAMQATFSAYNNNISTNGAKSKDGVYDPQMKQMDLNQLDTMLQTPADLRRAFRTKIGFSETSFFDDLNTKGSSVSLDLYNTLLSVTGSETTEGELALTGVAEGIVDADNSGGISQKELLDAGNYSILAGNILGMRDPGASKAYFKEYASKEFEKSFQYGYSNRPEKKEKWQIPGTPEWERVRKAGGGGGSGTDTDSKDGGHVGSSMGGVGWVPGSKKQEYRGYIDKFANFQGNYGNYKFDESEGKYYDANAEKKVFMTSYEVAQKEDAAKGDPAENFFYSPDSKTQVELNKEQTKGLATWDMLNFDDDNEAAEELNDWFFPKGSNSVKFKPYRPDFSITGISDIAGESVWTNDLMIVNPVSGEPYKDDAGDIYRFSTDGSQKALQDVINNINSNPIISPFVKPRTKPSA